MRILYIAPYTSDASDSGSLAARAKVALVCSALRRAGHRVVVLSSAAMDPSRLAWVPGSVGRLSNHSDRATVVFPGRLLWRPFGALLNLLRAPWIALRIARSIRPDLVICYNSYLFEYLAAAALRTCMGVPAVLQIEDLPLARRRGWLNLKPRLDQMAWTRMLRTSKGFTAVSTEIRKVLPAGTPAMVFPGVVSDLLLRAAAVRSAPFTSAGEIRIGYFGALNTGKGADRLLQLIEQAPAGLKFVVSGNGPLAERFAAYARGCPERLTFLGVVPRQELYSQMCSCDICVVPPEAVTSSGSVFPFKLSEYVVSGCHVLAAGLPPESVAALGLSFIQQWDGTVDHFFQSVELARDHYLRTDSARRLAVENISQAYSLSGIAAGLSRLIESACKPRVAGPSSAPIRDF